MAGPIKRVSEPSVAYALEPAVPNPSSGEVQIRYSLARDARAVVTIYNAAGRRMRTLGGGDEAAGLHEVIWDGRDDAGSRVRAGVYFYRMVAGEWHSERKVIVLER